MRKLNRPSHDTRATYLTCISRIRDLALKARLQSVVGHIEKASLEYDEKAQQGELHTILQESNIANMVTIKEMEAVYTSRMAGKRGPGRKIYDELRGSAPQNRCPFCAHRDVSTLDHYLPKTQYPTLAVTPINLVPSCADCNKAKLIDSPTSREEMLLHPYFDDIEEIPWLEAKVIETTPASILFFVNRHQISDDTLARRITYHLRMFGLGILYSAQAAEEICNIAYSLSQVHARAGEAGVHSHLQEQAESRARIHINSWQTVTYKALAQSAWFCGHGYSFQQ